MNGLMNEGRMDGGVREAYLGLLHLMVFSFLKAWFYKLDLSGVWSMGCGLVLFGMYSVRTMVVDVAMAMAMAIFVVDKWWLKMGDTIHTHMHE
jgi:hypothetical protein